MSSSHRISTLPEAAHRPVTPAHVAFIMDGNGRWAQARGKPVMAGHRAGAEAVRRCMRGAIENGVRYLTLYAFSSENWRRTAEEVNDLTTLLRFYLRHKVMELHREGVRLCVIGDLSRFDRDLCAEIARAEELTRHNVRLTMVLALSYGARADLLNAARRLVMAAQQGALDASTLTEDDLASHLQTHDFPNPDLVVRTSGERRLSNFLLWESAYAELAFLDVLWPDFDETHFSALMDDYARRERRFGGRKAQAASLP